MWQRDANRTNALGKNGPDRLAWCRVATHFQSVKKHSVCKVRQKNVCLCLDFVGVLGSLYSCLSSNLGSFQPLFRYSLCSFFSVLSFWVSHSAYVGPRDGVLWVHLSLFTFFPSFSFCSSGWITCIVLSSSLLILCYACSNLPLTPSSEISIALEFLFHFFLGFLSLYRYLHFVHTLFSWLSPHLSLVLWASF